MAVEIITKDDLNQFKKELIQELLAELKPTIPANQDRFLKSGEVRKLLQISAGTLQNLRNNGTLPFKKLSGTIYYQYSDVIKILDTK